MYSLSFLVNKLQWELPKPWNRTRYNHPHFLFCTDFHVAQFCKDMPSSKRTEPNVMVKL